MRYWLFKSEPQVFSFQQLKEKNGTPEPWNGVRNYQVRNMLKNEIQSGDLGFFYHSSCPQPGIAGVLRVQGPARPDPTQFDPSSEYYDPKSSPEDPRWWLVDVVWEADLPHFIPLSFLREDPRLCEMTLLRKGNRLSITEVSEAHFQYLRHLDLSPS